MGGGYDTKNQRGYIGSNIAEAYSKIYTSWSQVIYISHNAIFLRGATNQVNGIYRGYADSTHGLYFDRQIVYDSEGSLGEYCSIEEQQYIEDILPESWLIQMPSMNWVYKIPIIV